MLPASDASASVSLELSDDFSQLHVTFFLEVRQHACSEEDLALTDAIQIRVQIQRLNLSMISQQPIQTDYPC